MCAFYGLLGGTLERQELAREAALKACCVLTPNLLLRTHPKGKLCITAM